MKTAIIGAGPAGLIAASIINSEVHIFDKNSDAGKKLLLTGNGKCNYWNKDTSITKFHSYNNELLNKFLIKDNLDKVFNYLSFLGVVPLVKNGYYYPYSEKANSIKSILKQGCNKENCFFHYDEEISNIEYSNNKYIINGIEFDKVVIATGSKAYPKTGSTGDGYIIAKKFGHNINEINPSLVALVTNEAVEKDWAGKRCQVEVSHNNKKEVGEIQFTNYGLSGICIFNLSRDISIGLNKGNKEVVHINFVPWSNNINEFLDSQSKIKNNANITELCDGFIDYNILNILLKKAKINHNSTWNSISNKEKCDFIKILTDFEVTIVDTKDYDSSQTCSGGIPLLEVNLNTFESLKQPNLYFCGEILDCDGDCGGYNLMLSFLTGFLVGEAIND